MNAVRLPCGPPAVRMALLALVGLAFAPDARALTPESPQVKEAVKKAVGFLESDAAKDERVGAGPSSVW